VSRVDWRLVAERAVNVTPLLLLNGFAAYGQAAWALDRITTSLPAAVAFAATVESVALVLASAAHRAAMAGDAAAGRRAASYAIAGVVGWLNWSHWSTSNPTAGAVYAAFSALSPWLWGMWSRDRRRAELRAAGLIDPRAVRFATVRWLLHTRRTWRVWRWAAWEGIGDPGEALAAYAAWVAGTPTPAPAAKVSAEVLPGPAPTRSKSDGQDLDREHVSPSPVTTPRPARPAPAARRPAPPARASAVDREAAAWAHADTLRRTDPDRRITAAELKAALRRPDGPGVSNADAGRLAKLVNGGRGLATDGASSEDDDAGERVA
jgi:hypothetical protein